MIDAAALTERSTPGWLANRKFGNSAKSGYNKGTIRSDLRYLVVSKDVRRHRLISISYISHGRCHGRGREFESRRPRHIFQLLTTKREWLPRLVFNPNSVTIPPHVGRIFLKRRSVGWKLVGRRTQVSYTVEFAWVDNQPLCSSAGSCWEVALSTCASKIVKDARSAARKIH
jgi:hypothetical protein